LKAAKGDVLRKIDAG